jgi:hypothetical protein
MPATQPTHRIWGHAALGAGLLLFGPTLMAAVSWLLGYGRDTDMAGGVFELVAFLLIIGALPSLLLSFGIMAPLAVVMDRVAGGQASRMVNVMAGIAVGLTGLAAFLWGGSMLAWQPGESFWQVMSRPLDARPEAAFVGVTLFALVGMIVAAGTRHRRRTGT